MIGSFFRMLFLLTISLTLFIMPMGFIIDFGGEAHAFSSSGGGSDGKLSDGAIAKTYKHTPTDPPPANAPEPTTMLLVGAGAIGLAVLKKKYKKK